MNYKVFQKILADEVRRLRPDRSDVRISSVVKNNGVVRDTLELGGEGSSLYPTIYMDSYYQAYCEGTSIRQLADRVLEQCAAYDTARTLPVDFFSDYEHVSSRVYCKLISVVRNRELLSELPHRMWLDLAVVCYYLVDSTILQDASILIRREHMSMWGIDEEALLNLAWENTLRVHTSIFRTLGSALAEMGEISSEDVSRGGDPLFLLTNQTKCFGAICICYPDMGARIADAVGEDYYILPSSVHECLILPVREGYDASRLNQMVREINMTQLAPQEVLSDHVYYYDRCQDKILLCGIESADN